MARRSAWVGVSWEGVRQGRGWVAGENADELAAGRVCIWGAKQGMPRLAVGAGVEAEGAGVLTKACR
jgi:hypothetical protein